MSETPAGPVVEALEPRPFRYAWLFLIILFVLALGNALSGSSEKKPAASPALTREEAALKNVVVMAGFMDRFGTKAQKEQNAASLDPLISALVQPAKKEPAAARMYAVMRREQGKPVPPEQLATLQGSPDPRDQQLARIYATDRLKREEAKAIFDALPATPFVFQAARIQAMEASGDRSIREELAPISQLAGMFVVGVGGCGLLLLSVFLWGAYFSFRREGKLAPLGHPLEPLTLNGADKVALRSAQIFALFMVVSILPAIVPLKLPVEARMIITGALTIFGVVVLTRIPIAGERITLGMMGLRREHLGRHILWGLAGFVANLPFLVLALLVATAILPFVGQPSHPASEMMMGNPSWGRILTLIFLASVVAPFWEEIMFRGLLFPALSRVWLSRFGGLVVSSFAFAAIHPQGVALWLGLASVAATSCMLTMQTRSLVPSIVMHGVHNFVVLMIGLLLT